MIDALELSVPESTRRRRDFWDTHKAKRAHRDSAHEWTIDCSNELSLFIHFGHRHRIEPRFRRYGIEFKSVRLFSVDDFIRRLGTVFEISEDEMLKLRVSRVDFAADVSGVPLDWFYQHCRVRYKRSSKKYFNFIEEQESGVRTLYAGRGADVYRIYNKVEEIKDKDLPLLYRGMFTGEPEPVVTRFERQCRGSKIPIEVNTFGKFFKGVAVINPFSSVELSGGGPAVDTSGWSAQKWLMNLGLQEAVRLHGLQGTRAVLNRKSKGNGKRIYDRYATLLNAGKITLTGEQLLRAYRRSTVYQLNQPDASGRYPQGGRAFLL